MKGKEKEQVIFNSLNLILPRVTLITSVNSSLTIDRKVGKQTSVCYIGYFAYGKTLYCFPLLNKEFFNKIVNNL